MALRSDAATSAPTCPPLRPRPPGRPVRPPRSAAQRGPAQRHFRWRTQTDRGAASHPTTADVAAGDPAPPPARSAAEHKPGSIANNTGRAGRQAGAALPAHGRIRCTSLPPRTLVGRQGSAPLRCRSYAHQHRTRCAARLRCDTAAGSERCARDAGDYDHAITMAPVATGAAGTDDRRDGARQAADRLVAGRLPPAGLRSIVVHNVFLLVLRWSAASLAPTV